MIVHHLNDLEQIVLIQLLQTLGQFVHVECLTAVGGLLLFLLSCSCANLASSLVGCGCTVGGIARNGAGIAKGSQENRLWVLEGYDMFDFVFRLLEVEVVKKLVGLAANVLQIDLEFELTPTIFCYAPWRSFEYCIRVNGSS